MGCLKTLEAAIANVQVKGTIDAALKTDLELGGSSMPYSQDVPMPAGWSAERLVKD